jgi:RNA polymerase sigma factor (sigma-70 family)
VDSSRLLASGMSLTFHSADRANGIFLSALPVIEQVTGQICRRNRVRATDADEFASRVRFALIENDCEVLRQYDRRGSLRAYLVIVIGRLFYDYRCEEWGRWRPSAEALRCGKTAIELEKLIERDGWSFDQAVEILRSHPEITESAAELYRLYVRLSPSRSPVRKVPERAAANVPSSQPLAHDAVLLVERAQKRKKIRAELDAACAVLSAEERLLIQLRIHDGLSVSRIAIALSRPQKRLYRTFQCLYEMLRQRLRAAGITASDIDEYFADIESGHDLDSPEVAS